eukprot:TRINITY_DN89738_c0_g1_i1.p1 TRINITY_DN89738_c0_g1~~TRINITY_DN89738_c0_g1_i1.p1  ORF type:complete len:298 (+),score=40.75 TRINITY_DN89738_c0_g1_i1:86-979(+)
MAPMDAPQQTASRIFGMAQEQEPVDSDELAARGFSQQQVNHIQARQYQRQVLQKHLARWTMFFLCGLCILLPSMAGVTMWLIVAWNNTRQQKVTCDAWLVEWVSVVYGLLAYHFFLHNCVIRYVCGYDAQHQMLPPIRVKLYKLMFPIFDFVWKITGLALAYSSTTCQTVMPNLHSAVTVYAGLGIVTTVFTLVNAVGIQTFVLWMMRHGMLTTDAAAPAGTLEAQSVVPFDKAEFGDDGTCSICLSDFTSKTEIRKTQCGHCFHTQCLKGWLNVNHTCPLCRKDLASPSVNGDPCV